MVWSKTVPALVGPRLCVWIARVVLRVRAENVKVAMQPEEARHAFDHLERAGARRPVVPIGFTVPRDGS